MPKKFNGLWFDILLFLWIAQFLRDIKKFLLAILVLYKNLYFSNNFMGLKWGKRGEKLKERDFMLDFSAIFHS